MRGPSQTRRTNPASIHPERHHRSRRHLPSKPHTPRLLHRIHRGPPLGAAAIHRMDRLTRHARSRRLHPRRSGSLPALPPPLPQPARRKAACHQYPARPPRLHPPLLRLALPLRHHSRQPGSRPRPAAQAGPSAPEKPQRAGNPAHPRHSQPGRSLRLTGPHHPRTLLCHRHPPHRNGQPRSRRL
jgi:hypothetical protein